MRALKVAVLSESSADDAAVRILVEAILGKSFEIALPERLRARRGWPAVRQILPNILKHLHYRTDADALAVVVDSDKSPLHLSSADLPERDCPCRRCEISQIAHKVQTTLRSRIMKPAIKLGIGLAVPSIEAWFRCGIDPHVSEAAWIESLQSNSFLYTTKSLKCDVYGSDTPGLLFQTQCAIKACQQLANQLDLLRRLFPSGFGPLEDDLSKWGY